MRAEELMINDWIVIAEPDRYAGATGQIKSLSYHQEQDAAYFYVFIQGKFGYLRKEVCSDDIRPILLTPEILEKNDFNYCNRDGGYYGYFNESYCNAGMEIILFNVKSEDKNVQIHISDANDENDVMFHLMECNHVHKLQHILKDCGIKKTIEL